MKKPPFLHELILENLSFAVLHCKRYLHLFNFESFDLKIHPKFIDRYAAGIHGGSRSRL